MRIYAGEHGFSRSVPGEDTTILVGPEGVVDLNLLIGPKTKNNRREQSQKGNTLSLTGNQNHPAAIKQPPTR